MSTASSAYGNGASNTSFSQVPFLFANKQNQPALSDQDSYDQVAQSLRKELREEDVEMEDASGWPSSWESEGEADLRDAQAELINSQQQTVDNEHHGSRKAEEHRPVVYLALDTNVFISHLNIVKSLHDTLSKQGRGPELASSEIKLLVPNTVIHGKYRDCP